MPEFCSVAKDGHLTVITLERPEVMNALHPPANAELSAAFDDFEADEEQWVAIITGSGDRAFCAGNDLKYQASGGDMSGQPASGFAGLTARYEIVKPVIAAVEARLGRPVPEDWVADLRAATGAAFERELQLVPGVLEALDAVAESGLARKIHERGTAELRFAL